MTVSDTLIHLRETFFNWLSGVDTDQVLNPPQPDAISKTSRSGGDVAAEVRRAVNEFKATAMDESGQHVDYSRLQESDAYQNYRKECILQIRNFDPSAMKTREEKLAFWINLYNALVIDAVIFFDVQKSVTEGWMGTLKFFRKAAYNVGGHRMSCEDIEHGVLRSNRGNPFVPGPHFNQKDPRKEWIIPLLDPRIHFALNCGSHSCPPIGVFSAKKIDAQLDLATQSFLSHETHLQKPQQILKVSSILKWYQSDFDGQEGLIDFILQHLPKDDQRNWLQEHRHTIKLQYLPYNWGLNV